MASEFQRVRVGDRTLRVSHLDKVMYPSTGTTKGDVIAYYNAIAATMLPHVIDRPVTRKRWPHGVGIDGTGAFFFQKDLGDAAPDWVTTGSIEHADHTNEYPIVAEQATLVWLAQLAALELHVPQWRFDEQGRRRAPDRLVLDLDPGPGATIRDCATVAFLVRDLLSDMGLQAIPVTSGSKGIHVYAGLDETHSSDEISSVAREIARALESDHPDTITSSMKKANRPGKVFIDWSQNRAAKTTIAPYSLRGAARPFVAAPRTWRELASPHLRQLELSEVLRRVEKRGDPMSALAETEDERVHQRLELYREKRDSSRTPEPVPELGEDGEPAAASPSASPTDLEQSNRPKFVIQRHEARRLHFDFRLEHQGVLVSWALPKGVPTDPKKNHLAVPTEDHPMAYRHFEGTIPRGEYGAGAVRIWDSGTYELEKWREDEVIVSLTGRPTGGLGGTRRYALFRTSSDPARPQWMIHLMDAPAHTSPLSPMLATRGTQSDLRRLDPEEWAVELKWDGMRVVAHVGAAVSLRSRSGREVSPQFPEFTALSELLVADSAVLDGEVLVLGPNGTPDFGALQERIGPVGASGGASSGSRVPGGAPVRYFVFDVLELNGTDCRDLPYRQRRELLEEVVEDGDQGVAVVPPIFDGDADSALAASAELGLEGIVAKRWQSRYRSGLRSSEWLKFPLIETLEVVVVGWRPSPGNSRTLASLLVAAPEQGKLRYVGRVGTGFTALERRRALEALAPLECDAAPLAVPSTIAKDARWVRPELVGEVTYARLTSQGHLRHAVWRGWRPDKSAPHENPTHAEIGATHGRVGTVPGS